MQLNGKRVDLPLLEQEASVAGVVVGPLGTVGLDADGRPDELITWDAEGSTVDVPPEMRPVLDAHDAPPLVVEFAGSRQTSSIVRTTSAAALEVARVPTSPRHVYRATVHITAIDAQSGTAKDAEARMLFKRLAASVVQVGSTATLWQAQDAQATGWTIQASVVEGTDLVIAVAGAAGRTIDWATSCTVDVYAPGGLA